MPLAHRYDELIQLARKAAEIRAYVFTKYQARVWRNLNALSFHVTTHKTRQFAVIKFVGFEDYSSLANVLCHVCTAVKGAIFVTEHEDGRWHGFLGVKR